MEYVTSTSFKGPCNEYLTRQDMQKAICRSSPNSILCTSNTVERVFFGSGEKNPKITIFRNFPEKLCSDWLFVLQWKQSPIVWHTSHVCPCVVTPWHVFADVMIVLFCKHTICGHWVLVLRIRSLAFLLNLVLLELVVILHFQIPKIRLFRKSKLAIFRKLHASEKKQ